MQWHEFIFSDKPKHSLLRHISFWVTWWIYFLFCYYLFQQPIPSTSIKPYYLTIGPHLIIKTFLLVLLYALACYALIYLFLPQAIKSKWLKFTSGIILIFVFLLTSSYFMYWDIFSWINSLFGSNKTNNAMTRFWPAVSLGILNFIKVAAAAAIIKYVKYWWLKQKESERLDKEKINAELQLLKAQVHPDFLFKTLNNIYTHALAASPRASGMLLKLSDLLSYMLYECDKTLVPLEKEIAMMKEYMQLERIRHNDEVEMEVSVKGDLTGKVIAPFLLLPFIENSFKHSSQMTEQFWINMNIRMEGDHFSMKLTNGTSEKSHEQTQFDMNGLANVQKRLTLLYPEKHELKMTSEQEMFIVFLNIKLDDKDVNSFAKEKFKSMTIGNEKSENTILTYASD